MSEEVVKQKAQVPRYQLMQDTFIAPHLIKAGKIIDYDGEPGPHMSPLNEAADAMMAAYYKAKPEASINPVQQLPIVEGAALHPTTVIVGEAPADPILSFVDMAANAAPGSGPASVTTLAEANAFRRA